MLLKRVRTKNSSLKDEVGSLDYVLKNRSAARKRVEESTTLKRIQVRLSDLQDQVELLRGEKARLQKEL